MRPALLDLARCPACGGLLELAAGLVQDDEVVDGVLACAACGATYPIVERLPRLYVDDEAWAPRAREAEGWVAMHREAGTYDEAGADTSDLDLPYGAEAPWPDVAREFELGLELAGVTGEETVLDLGAGRGWAAARLAALGCRAVAVDVLADPYLGLGRGFALMARQGSRFDPVVADAERLPFADGAFDLVFAAAALHHTDDLPRLLRSVHRVLAPGGRLLAVREPCRGLRDPLGATLARDAGDELAHGIVESRPTYVEWWDALEAAGFEDFELIPAEGRFTPDDRLHAWAAGLGGVAPPREEWTIGRLPRIAAGAVRRPWRSRTARGLPPPSGERQRLERAGALHGSTSLVVLARAG